MNADYLELANQQFHNKNYQAALANYDLAIRNCPSLPEAYYRRGLVKRIMGNHHEAIQDLSIATILNPKMVSAYYYRGISYYETGDFPYAIANYNHAIFLDPKLANAYYQRAIIRGELGYTHQAIKDFKLAASLAREQNNSYLYKRAKKAQVLAKKLKGSNRYNKSLLLVFKVGLLTAITAMTIGHIKYINHEMEERENYQQSLYEQFKNTNNQ